MVRPTADERQRLSDGALREIYWSRPASAIVPRSDHLALYTHAADHVGRDKPIVYLEFGVAQGLSMSRMTSLFSSTDSRFYGFDSFVGLPEDWLMHSRGAFSNNGVPPALHDKRVTFVKGWFQNSLPAFLKSTTLDRDATYLVHFDADLYSSDLFLLTTLWHAIGSYFFIFDDFIYDDVIALSDFMAAYPVSVEFMAQTRGGGDERPNPDQVFGSMKRIEMVVPTD